MSDAESEADEPKTIGEYEGDRNEAGERHGFGKAVFHNGDVYHGEFKNGKRDGQLFPSGVATSNHPPPPGSVLGIFYSALTRASTDLGTYFFKNGARYVGEYCQGLKQGQGIFYYPDGSKYEGSWVDDQRQGRGVYTYYNGDTYDGDWLHHMRHGQGIYHYHESGSQYKGNWVNGNMELYGEFIHLNYRYQGNISKNMPYGSGKYVFDIGCEQHGEYQQVHQDQTESEMDEFSSDAFLKWTPKYITGLTQCSPGKETSGAARESGQN